MNLKETQQKAANITEIYGRNFGVETDAEWCLLKLQEELGELVSAYLKLSGKTRAKGPSETAMRQNLRDEIADVLGFALAFSEKQGIDANQAFKDKWLRYLEKDSVA